MWYHPKYYQELAKIRKQFEKEQADKATGNKPTSDQAQADKRPSHKPKGSGANLPSQEK
jgi:hypothetical protein